MDKKLNRVVGFQKPKGESEKPEPKKKQASPEKKDEIKPDTATEPENDVGVPKVENDGKKLVVWLSERDFINRSALCKAAKVDRGNFDKYMKGGEFPEKVCKPIIQQLKKYGYDTTAKFFMLLL